MSESPSTDRDLDLSEVANESPEQSVDAEIGITGDGPEGDVVPEDDAQ